MTSIVACVQWKGAIDVGDSHEDVQAVDVGGPSEQTGLDLNRLTTYKTPPRKSPRRRINIDQTPP